MAHLTINPDSANAWVVILKEGETTFGRADDNDVRVEEGGISSHHCKVILDKGNVTIIDLNSTNGTNVNGSRVTQAVWNPGQIIHLGQLPVRLEGAQPVAVATPVAAPVAVAGAAAAPPPIPVPMPTAAAPAAKGPMRLRISGSAGHSEPAPAAAAVAVEAAPADLPPPVVGSSAMTAPPGTRCKSHNQSLAKWYCGKCRKFFCDLCITMRPSHTGNHHLCRACGGECQPVHTEREADGSERGFFARIPGAFLYPVKGMGVVVLIIVTIIYAGSSMMGGIFGWIFQMMATGYLFVFLQSIIHCSAAGDDEMPSMPEFDGLFGAFFTLLGTIIFCFSLPIGLLIAKFADVDIPPSFIVASIFLCLIYFPMAFLSVAMNDSVMAVNPMVVIPAILKVPLHYAATVIILCCVFGVRILGDTFTAVAGGDALSTRDMSVMFMSFGIKIVWALLSIYLLAVGIRILGILYVTNKEKIGWF